MSHEEFWSWLYWLATGRLGMSPAEALSCDMSDILLAWEGRQYFARIDAEARERAEEGLIPFSFDNFRAMQSR
jgi:hypothetical protein